MTKSNDSCLVSIVLPVYNGERFLRQAIDSVISQEYSNWELILVDDCSTDSTLDIMKQYECQDERIQLVCNEHNLKLPKSLNVGFRAAKGRYYTWTSDDNYLHPKMLKRLVEELDKDNQCGMVYSDFMCIDEEGNEIYERNLDEPKALGTVGSVLGASFLYRREISEQVGEYDPDLFLAEDYDYWMRIYAKSTIKHIPEVLYYYRIHDRSLTTTKEELIKSQTLRAIQKNFWSLYEKADNKQDRKKLFNMLVVYGTEADNRLITRLLREMHIWWTVNRVEVWFKCALRRILTRSAR